MAKAASRYGALIEKIFFDRYIEGATEIEFIRSDIESAAEFLDGERPLKAL